MNEVKHSTKLKKDDLVKVISGKDRGKQGKILHIDMVKGRAIVQGLNMMKKAMRKKSQNDRGGIAEIEAPLRLCNVMIVCKKCGPTRLGYKFIGTDKKRVCRKCGEAL
ncbi:MAG: 50S ribosomal protein L24 [Spirochaetes bacterium GWD1_61_31]|nr:MAG: 50S ribosomal protein L24 [Spirochaetes bacterium GWB1_60_80]OHD29919.1 MAG: 50S ribosomal protein L24 [Spirochaetes bacterium GWC1_61_12]OHD43776.1 MAG: 50S ribosomal protein L24 [Spirochaetes bacterium GWD1_61_31]OHD46018.1 MAG: 50S ribosomal protein L24 [Spirochaetes bacterium GWE1_60_18]OHD60590.1 MAG: 50S ribosomal protein L24 [Spirochaetes bacterium GWF1_60_12]HAP43429.1 50S ribosomal protein L24 [Spirochaetaceae bacterium]